MRKISFYLILIILQLVFVDLVLQTFYRVTNGDWLFRRVVLPMYAADDVRVYSVKPNLDYAHITNEFRVNYYTDNLGYRAASPEKVTQIEKADDVYRVLFLGPSFPFPLRLRLRLRLRRCHRCRHRRHRRREEGQGRDQGRGRRYGSCRVSK